MRGLLLVPARLLVLPPLRSSLAFSLTLLLLVAPPASAQSDSPPATAAPTDIAQVDTFETARILPSKSVGATRINMSETGRFEATNASLRWLIRFAYQVQDFQIAGGPSWIESQRFDIVAQRPSHLTPQLDGTPRLRARVRALLADRFRLKVDRETRELPTYDLVMARADRSTGRGLRESALDCLELARQFARNRDERLNPPEALTRCGVRMSPGSLSAGGVSMNGLARALSQLTGRAVENRTALEGVYDVQLDYFHELAPPTDATPSAERLDTGPSLFTALQEQLGLRLESKRGPVDMLIIAHVERPWRVR